MCWKADNSVTMDGLVKNTLMFKFPEGAPGPTVVEMARFVKAFDADKFTMESSYKISEERCFCIKFMNERSMKDALMQNTENHVFQYSSGETVEIKMSIAGGCSKYIRIFDLPPEVPDQELATVLGRYGTVRRMVREKFPAQLELDLTTGVRGVHIEIKKEIPATLFFLNRRGRIYYEGVKHKCFLCKEEGHLKAECPRNTANKARNLRADVGDGSAEPSEKKASTPQTSYAMALKSKPPPAVVEPEGCKMTVLAPATKVAVQPAAKKERSEPSNTPDAPTEERATNAPAAESGAVGEDDTETDILDESGMEADDSAQPPKRQHESSSTEDEGNGRPSRTRKQKKDDDALSIIATVPILPKGRGRNRSKN